MAGSLDDRGTIDAQYGDPHLSRRILAALGAAGRDLDALGRDDLAAFDEFHGGGRASTRALARLACVAAGERVLDVGCGIGGPARTLAAEFGARVDGVDLTESFVEAARMLTARLGMESSCTFHLAGATSLPFDAGPFDLVWSQNVLMNVADKGAAFGEMARVLAPGGRVALELNVRAGAREPVYPTFWADTAAVSHLVTRGELEALLEAAGLRVETVEDGTAQSVATAEKRARASAGATPDPLGLQLLVRRNLAEKFANGLRNYREGRTRALQVVARKTTAPAAEPGGCDA